MFICIFFMSFFHVLLSPKRTKRPATGKISHNSLLLTSRKQHPSVGYCLPTNPFILFLGGAELLQLATRYSEHLTSSQTVLATLSKNRMGFVCDFDGDGFSLILPLSAIKLIPRQRRNGTVEKSNGGPLVFRPLCEDCLKISAGITFLI